MVLKAKTLKSDGKTTVLLSGEIDDTAGLAAMMRKMEETPILDLSDVSGITASGIKSWQEMLTAVRPSGQLILERCSTNIIDAFNLHPELLAQTPIKIISMALPYYCDNCDKASTLWVEPKVIKVTFQAPQKKCAVCKNPLELDTIADKYFMFLKRRI